jgi:hypothetical protein
MTDAVAQCLDEPIRRDCTALVHEFEGLGQKSTYYMCLVRSAVQPSTALGLGNRLKLRWNRLPFLIGAKEPCEGFRSLDRGAPELSAG